MELSILKFPRAVPDPRMRTPQANIPQTGGERAALAFEVRRFVQRERPVPPMPIDELRRLADDLLGSRGIPGAYRDFAAVLINNEAWRDTLASIPYDRRLLLLPKCLRVESKCPAPFDEFGLLCKKCGLCSIQDLQDEAERLGYAVLVAEGSALVTAIIQTGKIEAIVGVSCLSVLERAFPSMEAAAIPGIAIPLLQDDCIDTCVDLDWVWDFIHLTSEDRTYRIELDAVRDDVESWFTPGELDRLMGPAGNETARVAREWLLQAGKRWRPFLTTCAYIALGEEPSGEIPDEVRRAAIAVECFHKASLVHDDIEDGDATRYRERTLHERYGVPVALNAGDFLLGEGYRLLADCGAPAAAAVRILQAAAEGHRTLSEGQGAELWWARHPQPLTSIQVLDIFRRKTAPAFDVALRIGAALADSDEDVRDAIASYSEALGIAYQIRDDLEDLSEGADPADLLALRPSVVLAVALERARLHDADSREVLEALWRRAPGFDASLDRVRSAVTDLQAEDRCQRLLDSYKEEAVRSLAGLQNATFKGLLRRVVGKIFNDLEMKGWCSEFEARNAAGREARAEAAV